MAFVSNQLDPLFESNDLKATGTGVYQEVFDTLDYDNVSGADLVDTLLDGMDLSLHRLISASRTFCGPHTRGVDTGRPA